MVRTALIAARALIEDPECWTRLHDAVDDEGKEVSVHDPTAVAYCASGAVEAVMLPGRHAHRLIQKADAALADAVPEDYPWDGRIPAIGHYNDDPDVTHAMLLDVFSRAIATQPVWPKASVAA